LFTATFAVWFMFFSYVLHHVNGSVTVSGSTIFHFLMCDVHKIFLHRGSSFIAMRTLVQVLLNLVWQPCSREASQGCNHVNQVKCHFPVGISGNARDLCYRYIRTVLLLLKLAVLGSAHHQFSCFNNISLISVWVSCVYYYYLLWKNTRGCWEMELT
jgi:hypothetical protein